MPTLLGVGVEYIASAVSYFERMRQIEESAEHIIVLAGPISYRARVRRFRRRARRGVARVRPRDGCEDRKALAQIDELMDGAAPAQGDLSPAAAWHRSI